MIVAYYLQHNIYRTYVKYIIILPPWLITFVY